MRTRPGPVPFLQTARGARWCLIVLCALLSGALVGCLPDGFFPSTSRSDEGGGGAQGERAPTNDPAQALLEGLPGRLHAALEARRGEVSQQLATGGWTVAGERLRWLDLLEVLYEAREHAPLFVGDEGLSERGLVLMHTLEALESHALDPAVFHMPLIVERLDALLIEPALLEPRDLVIDDEATGALRGWLAQHPEAAQDPEAVVAALLDPARTPAPRLTRELTRLIEAYAERDRQLADLERMLADALLSYAHVMRLHNTGDVADPTRLARGDEQLGRERLVALFGRLEALDLDVALADLEPPWPQYAKLRQALASYRRMVADGGWTSLELPGRRLPLERRDHGENITWLQRRLAAEGYYEGEVDGHFGDDVAAGLKAYQRAHQLEEDGAVDADDLASLNVPAEVRLAQIEVTLERWRGSRIGDDDYHIFVNLPDFHGEIWRGGERRHRFRVIVGSTSRFYSEQRNTLVFPRATPLFSDRMRSIVFNPYWVVPENIRRNELEENTVENPNWYEENGFDVVALSGGGVQVRQRPGPDNALGQVKFLFPNDHYVYMHDTPDRHLFRHELRAFSHGCIRVHEPLEFARVLMENDGLEAPETRIARYVETGSSGTYGLREAVPVHIEYYVVRVHDDGRVHFNADLYRYDRPRIAERLERRGLDSERLLASR